MLHENRVRAQSFGAVADAYDRTRPSYPAALIDDLLAGAPAAVLDVGCGTGIVAALIADRGCRVLGVEADLRMAKVARAKGLEVEVAPFETWDARGRRFDVLTCGQAWHWVAPGPGAAKAAEALTPDGLLGLFWNIGTLPPALTTALDEVYAGFGPDTATTLRGRRDGRRHDTEALFSDHPAFTEVTSRGYAWSRSYTTREWTEQLATHSDHAVLDAATRARVLEAVAAVIDGAGGRLDVAYETVLVSARRRGD